jgi:membrane protein CcdC involved in cytochrome C biogenesis
MDNLIPQYEPNNEVFKQIVFCALCLSAGIFYFLFKLFSHSSFEWYDGLVLGAVGAGAGFFYKKAQEYEKNREERL